MSDLGPVHTGNRARSEDSLLLMPEHKLGQRAQVCTGPSSSEHTFGHSARARALAPEVVLG